MRRKAYRKLLEWKESETRKPLVLLGARQVGKTWLMREFGNKEYKNVAYINCDNEQLMQNLFLKDYDIQRLLIGFQAITGEEINPGTTLIILDEIQQAPRGLHSLKYFCENAPEYHVMAAGSLLGVTLMHNESFPVGKVDMLNIFPMDFEEFLDATGNEDLCAMLLEAGNPLTTSFAGKLEDYLFQYYFVGGMPEVVDAFVRSANLTEVRKIQNSILDAYRMDISKHTSTAESIRIGQVLSVLPSQLAKESKRFVYGAVRKGARASDFEVAIQWLADAGLIHKSIRLSKVAMPLKFYEEMSIFKLFFLDTGLLCCMADVPPTVLLPESNVLVEYKGMITEQYTAQQLIARGFPLHYWSNDKTPAELDFVIQIKDEVIPIEVKSARNVRGKSLKQYSIENPGKKTLRFSLQDYKVQGDLTNIPLYEVPFWADRVER